MNAYWQAVFLFFVFGLGFGGTVSVGVIYAQEFMMRKHRAFCIAALVSGASMLTISFISSWVVTLTLTTEAGPGGEPYFDWALWADLHFRFFSCGQCFCTCGDCFIYC